MKAISTSPYCVNGTKMEYQNIFKNLRCHVVLLLLIVALGEMVLFSGKHKALCFVMKSTSVKINLMAHLYNKPLFLSSLNKQSFSLIIYKAENVNYLFTSKTVSLVKDFHAVWLKRRK